MAIPTAPTDTSIVTNAYKDFGVSSPTSSQIARAISDGIEWVKRDMTNLGHEWKFMMKRSYIITAQGQNNYAVPTDYMKFISARIMEGTRTGTAQGGSTAVCTLASSETVSSSDILGKTIVFTGGTGANQGAQVVAYSTSSKVATFDVVLDTAVASGSTYLIVETYDKLEDEPVTNLGEITIPSMQLKPTVVIHDPNSIEGRLMTNYTPNKVYAIELRYYGDLMKEDLTGTRYTTFLRLAAKVLIQGVFVWLLQDDDRHDSEFRIYLKNMRDFANRQLYGYDLSHTQMQTGEE